MKIKMFYLAVISKAAISGELYCVVLRKRYFFTLLLMLVKENHCLNKAQQNKS